MSTQKDIRVIIKIWYLFRQSFIIKHLGRADERESGLSVSLIRRIRPSGQLEIRPGYIER